MKINYIEKNCDICDKLYKYDSRQKISKYCSIRCRGISQRQKNIKGELNIDYVICEICGFKFKEINNDHLSLHRISCIDYDKIYGCNKRVSEKTKINKNTLGPIMSAELSIKLSNSHKLDSYLEKYGNVEGNIKYNEIIKKYKYKNGISSYLDKYGQEDGLIIFSKIQKKKAINIENQIEKHGEELGLIKYNNWLNKQKNKNYLYFFTEKYGYEIGLKKWLEKNDKISLANSKIVKEDRKEFLNYIIEVNKFTRISLNCNNLLNIELRGNEFDLDHMVSKVDGFKNKIPSYIIGHISNLKIVDRSYNRKKQHKSDNSFSYIIEKYENDIEYKKLINDILESYSKILK